MVEQYYYFGNGLAYGAKGYNRPVDGASYLGSQAATSELHEQSTHQENHVKVPSKSRIGYKIYQPPPTNPHLVPSPPKPHLHLREPMQRPQKHLIPDPTAILHVKDLRQPHLPRRIAVQTHMRAEQDQQVRLAHDALADLGVDQVERDVGGRQLGALRHFRQRLGEVDEGEAAVVGGEEEDREVVFLRGEERVSCKVASRG